MFPLSFGTSPCCLQAGCIAPHPLNVTTTTAPTCGAQVWQRLFAPTAQPPSPFLPPQQPIAPQPHLPTGAVFQPPQPLFLVCLVVPEVGGASGADHPATCVVEELLQSQRTSTPEEVATKVDQVMLCESVPEHFPAIRDNLPTDSTAEACSTTDSISETCSTTDSEVAEQESPSYNGPSPSTSHGCTVTLEVAAPTTPNQVHPPPSTPFSNTTPAEQPHCLLPACLTASKVTLPPHWSDVPFTPWDNYRALQALADMDSRAAVPCQGGYQAPQRAQHQGGSRQGAHHRGGQQGRDEPGRQRDAEGQPYWLRRPSASSGPMQCREVQRKAGGRRGEGAQQGTRGRAWPNGSHWGGSGSHGAARGASGRRGTPRGEARSCMA